MIAPPTCPLPSHHELTFREANDVPEPEVNLLQILGRPEVQCSLLAVL